MESDKLELIGMYISYLAKDSLNRMKRKAKIRDEIEIYIKRICILSIEETTTNEQEKDRQHSCKTHKRLQQTFHKRGYTDDQ